MTDAGMALLIAVSRRHLREALQICERGGEVGLPVLEPGDLATAPEGLPVLILAAADGEQESRSVGWRATLRRWSTERGSIEVPTSVDDEQPRPTGATEREDDEDEDERDDPADPVWIVVSELHELALAERVHTNELVPKRERGARFYVPRAPRLVRLPD